ncbi:unnamed protein product [Porites lobata]|uniref:Uncharacterized protein n=1 Tax=Porites lobata TaxID=104759 RepID=A0ABN8MVC2_9CNID|nr:unnamed protein product [Porites lobata]
MPKIAKSPLAVDERRSKMFRKLFDIIPVVEEVFAAIGRGGSFDQKALFEVTYRSFNCILCMGCHHVRRMSSLVNVEKQGKVAVLELNRKPVNSFSLDFLQKINENLDQIENDQDCCGIIITSGLPKVSSTGLDLVKEVYKPSSEKQLSTFWQAFQEMWFACMAQDYSLLLQ